MLQLAVRGGYRRDGDRRGAGPPTGKAAAPAPARAGSVPGRPERGADLHQRQVRERGGPDDRPPGLAVLGDQPRRRWPRWPGCTTWRRPRAGSCSPTRQITLAEELRPAGSPCRSRTASPSTAWTSGTPRSARSAPARSPPATPSPPPTPTPTSRWWTPATPRANKLKVGSTVTVDKVKFTVIGIVTQPQGSSPPDIYIPLARAQAIGTGPGGQPEEQGEHDLRDRGQRRRHPDGAEGDLQAAARRHRDHGLQPGQPGDRARCPARPSWPTTSASGCRSWC